MEYRQKFSYARWLVEEGYEEEYAKTLTEEDLKPVAYMSREEAIRIIYGT